MSEQRSEAAARRLRPSSRSCAGSSTAIRSPTSTRRRPRRRRRPVIDAMTRYYTESRASIHRGVYPLAVEATDLYEGARERIARLAAARRSRRRSSPPTPPRRSTSSPTRGAGSNVDRRRPRGAHRDGAPLQHRAVADALPGRGSAELAYVPVLDDGQLDLEALDELLARGPKLVAVVHVSNVLGTINPVAEIVRRAHEAGAVVLIDGDPGGAADAGRPARDRRRLLRLDRPQGLRPDRASACCTAGASCSRRCRRSSAAGT